MLIKRREPRTLAGESPDELRGIPAYSRPRRPPSPIRLVAVSVGAVLLLVVLVLAIPAIGTLLTLKGAGDDLRSGASRLEGKGLDLTTADTAAADANFQSAEKKFVNAESGLHSYAAFGLLSAVSFGKRQVTAAVILSRSGAHIARAGHLGVQVANSLIAAKILGPGPHGNTGEAALALLVAVTPRLDPIVGELSAAQTERNRLPSGWLVWPIRSAVSSFDGRFSGAITALRELPQIEPGLRALLGASGPQLYLILQQDPAEMRATGGFIGSIGFTGFDHGKMRPYESHPVESLDIDAHGKPVLGFVGGPRYVEPPAPFKLLIPHDSWELRDANWSPDFPTAAQQAQTFFTLEQHEHLKASGVISIDPNLVADLLTVTGPVYLPETKQTISSSNYFADTIQAVEHGIGKSILSYTSKAIMEKLSKIGPSGLLHVLSVIQRGCDARSIQAYFTDPAAEAMVARYNCTGRIVPLTSDGLFVVDTNVGGSKDDFWVTRRFNVAMQVHPDGSVTHTLLLHYDGSQLVPRGDLTLPYRDWLRVYLPQGAKVTHIEGIGGHGLGPQTVSELGRTVVQGWMEFGFGESFDVSIVYDVPASAFPDSHHHLDLYWQKQGGRLNDPIQVSLQLPAGWTVTDTRINGSHASGNPLTADLAVDRQFSFSYQSP